MPESVENLFEYAKLRRLAEEVRVVSIDKTPNGFAVKLNENARVAPERLMQFLSENPESSFTPNGALKVVTKEENLIDAARKVLESVKQ
jgi:transcription-repair coupling factor (superfamily II helicase)